MRIIFAFMVVTFCFGVSFGQTKKITNLDLEKYKQQRLAAEKDYRDNHVKMGFPSPEELEKQRKDSAEETERIAERLRFEQSMRDYADAQRQYAENQAFFNHARQQEQNNGAQQNYNYLSGNGFYGYPVYFSNQNNFRPRHDRRQGGPLFLRPNSPRPRQR